MIHDSALMALMALTHIFCLAVMTERKYSIKIKPAIEIVLNFSS